MDFDATGELLILYFAVIKYFFKNGNTVKQCINYYRLKEPSNSVGREVLYNIFILLGIPMKLVRLIKLCLNETCRRVRVSRNLSDMFPVQNSWRRDDLSPLLFHHAIRVCQ